MTERRPRQTLTRISVSSIARKIYAIAVSPNPTWDEYEWLVNTSKNEIVMNDFKRALEIDVMDTPRSFDRMNGDKMAELMRDQKIISKALALLIELQDETRHSTKSDDSSRQVRHRTSNVRSTIWQGLYRHVS